MVVRRIRVSGSGRRRAILSGSTRLCGEATLQRMTFKKFDPNDPDLVVPKKYFTRRFLHPVKNNLASESAKRKETIIERISASLETLVDLVVENHLDGISVAEAIKPENLRVSWKTGHFVFKEMKTIILLTAEKEKEELRSVAELMVSYLEHAEGEGAFERAPYAFIDLIRKLRADDPNVKLIVCHPFFFRWFGSVGFRILLDVQFRKPVLSTSTIYARATVEKMLSSFPYLQGRDLENIVTGHNFLKSWWERSRELRKKREAEQCGNPELVVAGKWETQLDEEKFWAVPVFGGEAQGNYEDRKNVFKACCLIALQRDGIHHVLQTDLPPRLKHLLRGVTPKAVVEMLNLEMPEFECKVMDLIEKHDLWDYSQVARLFARFRFRLKEVVAREKLRAKERKAKEELEKKERGGDQTGGAG